MIPMSRRTHHFAAGKHHLRSNVILPRANIITKRPSLICEGRFVLSYCICIGLPPARMIILITPGPNADACTIKGLSILP